MSHRFRELLRKVGSGQHTSESLTREEAAEAASLMLHQEATPAQIGAFMIAHRIKRPSGLELAGMLDTYRATAQLLTPIDAPHRPLILNSPYDGRSRTAPVSPITALILVTAGCPVILHGGQRMPTKYGMPLVEIWQGLGLDWAPLSIEAAQAVFERTRLGFVYMPNHFPEAQGLVPYRDQLGKRPPQATLELMWCPYQGEAIAVCGFVHPPTEQMIQDALAHHGGHTFITVKGLEGSCDLPRDRTCIIGLGQIDPHTQTATLERLLLHPRDYGFAAKDVPLESDAELIQGLWSVLRGDPSELMQTAIWNGGFYLWRAGLCESLENGLSEAQALLSSGRVAATLSTVQSILSDYQNANQDMLIKT